MISKSAKLSTGLVFAALILVFAGARLAPATEEKNDGPSPQQAESRLYRVKRTIDGDTLELDTGERVRLIGVNSPETNHPTRGLEPYGHQATAFTKKMVEGKNLRLEYDVERKDKYGRTLAYAYLEDGTFINAELVRQGYAQIMTIPPNVKYVDLFVRLQREARQARRGLWSD